MRWKLLEARVLMRSTTFVALKQHKLWAGQKNYAFRKRQLIEINKVLESVKWVVNPKKGIGMPFTNNHLKF